MKQIFTVVFSLAMALLFSQTASGQRILGKIANKAKEKIEQRAERSVEEEIDKKVDEAIDSLDQSGNEPAGDQAGDTDKQQQRAKRFLKGIGISTEPVPVEESYSFSAKTEMHIESYDGKGKKISDGDFITWMSPNEKNFGYEVINGDIGQQGKGVFILDFKNKATIILSDENGKKTGMVFGFNLQQGEGLSSEDYKKLEEEVPDGYVPDPYFTKTGRTKNILGYSCEEYRYNNPDEDTEGSFWITKDLSLRTRDIMGTVFKSAAYTHGMGWGYLMESEGINKKTKERSLMKVTAIDPNASVKFSLGDYTITNLGTMSVPAGNQE